MAAAQTPVGTVRVKVIDARTQLPVAGAVIELTGPPSCFSSGEVANRECWIDLPDNEADLLAYLTALAQARGNRLPTASGPPSAVTDTDGIAVFQNVEFGRYGIRAQLNGYVSLSPRQADATANPASPASPSPTLSINEKQPSVEVPMAMVPMASIRGRILDSDGRPVADARLVVGVTTDDASTRSFLPLTSVTTSKAGEYTVALAPGLYAVRLHAPPDPAAPVYFPGVADLSKASVLNLDAGRSMEDINFTAEQLTRTAP